jgi:hypothetical protein
MDSGPAPQVGDCRPKARPQMRNCTSGKTTSGLIQLDRQATIAPASHPYKLLDQD